jgi:DNA-binding CsgD family transcriptional regulator
MSDPVDLIHLIDEFYALAEKAGAWDRLAENLAAAFGAAAASLSWHDASGAEPPVEAAFGVDKQLRSLLWRFWSEREESLSLLGAALSGGVILTGRLGENGKTVPARQITALAQQSGSVWTQATLVWPAGSPAPSKKSLDVLRALAPHLRRAWRLTRREPNPSRSADGAWAVLDRLPMGILLVGPGGAVVRINRAAQTLLARRDGLRVEEGRLTAGKPEETAAMSALVRAALETRGGPALGGTMRLPRTAGQGAYQVCVIPLGAEAVSEREAQAAILVSDPSLKMETTHEILERAYALTPAEARLAKLLLSGRSLRECAADAGTSIHTVRSQLRELLVNTGARGQADLLRILLTAGICVACTAPRDRCPVKPA